MLSGLPSRGEDRDGATASRGEEQGVFKQSGARHAIQSDVKYRPPRRRQRSQGFGNVSNICQRLKQSEKVSFMTKKLQTTGAGFGCCNQ